MLTSWLCGVSRSRRIMAAAAPPMPKSSVIVTVYRMPMRL